MASLVCLESEALSQPTLTRVVTGTGIQQDAPSDGSDELEVGFCLQVRSNKERLEQEPACEYQVVEFFVSHSHWPQRRSNS